MILIKVFQNPEQIIKIYVLALKKLLRENTKMRVFSLYTR